VLGLLQGLLRAREDVAIEVPSRTFEAAFPRARRFLLWKRERVVRRRFVVAALPLRELLVVHAKVYRLAGEFPRITPAEACLAILGSLDALELTDTLAQEIVDWWHEVNCLSKAQEPARAGTAPSSVMDLVLQLERWPFNFPTERVMRMTAAEAIARLQEFERAAAAARAEAVA
jgi:hypothetical protein